jgi:pyruvate dehydrogenase E2 component (dihydrolipoamide acetyltransferase)
VATVEDILLPDIGDFTDVEVIEILVAPGDRIEVDQSLLTLESDKASMEIPSPVAGTLKALKIAIGDRIQQGSLLAQIETDGDAAQSAQPSAEPTPESATEPAPEVSASRGIGTRTNAGTG